MKCLRSVLNPDFQCFYLSLWMCPISWLIQVRSKSNWDLAIRNEGSEDEEDEIVEEIVAILENSKKPAVVVGVLAEQYGALVDAREFLDILKFSASGAILRTFLVPAMTPVRHN